MTNNESLFIWRNFDSWKEPFTELLFSLIPGKVINRIVQNPPEYYYFDNLRWLEDACKEYASLTVSQIDQQLADRFSERYSAIRLFHGCRTEDVGSYLRSGFLPLEISEQIERIKQFLLSNKLPKTSNKNLQIAIEQSEGECRDGNLYLVIDDVGLITHASQYLKYGSEYLSVVLANLSRITGNNYLENLKEIGIPTVFVCNVPLSIVSKSAIESLVVELVSYLLEELTRPTGEQYWLDFTFEWFEPLPPTVIESHYHPQKIFGNRGRSGDYSPSVHICPYCE